MQQLIDPEVVEKVLLLIAVTGPLAGLIIGILIGAHEKHAAPRMVGGLLLGSLGTLLYGLWRVYGLITGLLGLDSVINLAVQLLLFTVIGMVLGAAIFKVSLLLKGSRRA